MIRLGKYKWSMRRFWKSWIKYDLYRVKYKLFHGWEMGGNGTMLPKLGRGKYVSVYSKGPITQVVNEEKNEEIRIIPYQPNHGVMVEYWEDGKMRWRQHLDLRQLKKSVVYASNVEQLTGRK